MDNFIFQPKPNHQITIPDNTFYCLVGKEDFLDSDQLPRLNQENDKRLAAKKIIREDGTIKYLIRTGDDRKLYNPASIYDTVENKKFLETIARNQNNFKEVNMMTFNLYLRFLKTKNTAYLTQAEREI